MKKLLLLVSVLFVVSCSSSVDAPAPEIKNTLTTAVNPTTGGTISPPSGQYIEIATVNITATPEADYVFSSWTGATGTTATTSVVMNSNKTVTANFVKKKYALTTSIEGEGTVTEKVIKAGAVTDYNSGTVVELTATPKAEWLFKEWTGDLTGTDNPKQITIDKAKTVTAVFVKKQYPLTVEIQGEGTVAEKVIKAGTATDYNSGTIVELTATAKAEWKFKEWSGDLTGTENPKEITIDKAKTVKAVFVKKQYSLNIEILGEGTVEKKVIKQGFKSDYNSGSIIELTAKYDDGWEFVKWDGDAKSFQNKIQITVNKKINLIVEFANTNQDFGYNKNTIIQGYGVVWGMDVLGVDEIIFTERSGKIYLFKSGIINELNSFPNEKINAVGQHGLLDVLKHPNYKENGFIYAVFSEKVEGFGTSKLNLVRFKLEGNNVINLESIFKINELTKDNGHFGSRITFDNDYLYLSVGEGSPSSGGINTPYDNAQNTNTNWGKIHRLNYDGTIPQTNPKFDKESNSSIFSMGHRNPQGLTFNPYSNEILSTEHGPQGGDEVNIIKSEFNYGWPYVSYGVNYGGGDISGKSHEGYEKPIYYWDPSIATSNLILLKDKNHNNWFKNLLVCGMKTGGIHRLDITDSKNVKQLSFINLGERTRNIREGINGDFYVSTDSGKIIKFSPISD